MSSEGAECRLKNVDRKIRNSFISVNLLKQYYLKRSIIRLQASIKKETGKGKIKIIQ
jgi:hypothetical protein